MKTQARIASVLFASNVLVILIFGVAVYYAVNKYSYNDFYKRLKTRATIATQYNLDTNRLSAEALKQVREEHLEKLFQEREYLIQLSSDSTLTELANVRKLPVNLLNTVLKENEANLKIGSIFYAGVKHQIDDKLFIVIVSADNYYSSHHLSFLRNVLFGGILLAAFISIVFAVYFSKHVFDPIKNITAKVKQITAESMNLRLEEKRNNNEINELITTFNNLLSRIETAFETQKNFISNASHEFRTPLTAIMGDAEVALNKERTIPEYKEVLTNILSHTERLEQVVSSLLFLAQTGYEGKKIAFERLRIDEVVIGVKTVMNNLIPSNQIHLDLSLLPDDPLKLKIRGNKELLSMALANILNNACKYSYNKPVTLSIGTTQNEVIIMIKDQGIGIPHNEIGYIYDPFFRASNTAQFNGYGIGLPLARNIIQLHEGTLTVTSMVNKGTAVQINLPAYSSQF